MRLGASLVLVLLGAGALAMPARADEADAGGGEGVRPTQQARPASPMDSPSWPHAGPDSYALTMFAVGGLAVYVPLGQFREPPLHWTGPILFDTPVRNLFRGKTDSERSTADKISWVLFMAQAAYPVVVDVPYAWAKYGGRAAWDLLWQDGTALTLASLFDLTFRDVVGRARPQTDDCLASGANNCLTLGTEVTRSFPGGHVAISTTAAVLTCTQHLGLHLYGGPWDAITCASGIAVDGAVGALRLVADAHYATDILAGYALGVLIGWGIPLLVRVHQGSDESSKPPAVVVSPMPVTAERGGGLGLQGWF